MEGRASEVQTAAFLIALRARARPSPSWSAWRARCAASRRRGRRRPRRPRRHRRAPAAGRRPSTSRRRRRSSPRGPDARSPSTATAPARAGRGSADLLEALGVDIELDPAGVAALHRRDRLRLHVRPAPPRGDEARRPGAQGARRADDLQLPRPADESRRAPRASCSGSRTAATRRRSPRRWSASAASARSSSPARTGSTSSRSRRDTRVIEVAGGGTEEWFVEPEELGLERAPAGRDRRRHARGERRGRRARCSTASRARRATSSCSTPARRSSSAAAPTTSADGHRDRPREAIDSGAARDVLERLVATHRRARGSG